MSARRGVRRYAGPTQKMRDMVEDLSWGGTHFADLHAELDRIEKAFGIVATTPTDENVEEGR